MITVVNHASDSSDFFLKVVTPLIIILTFIIKEFLTYRYFVKQFRQSRQDFDLNLNNSIELAKKNWYLNVLVQPNVKKINEFYEQSISVLKTDIEELKIAEASVLHSEYISLSISKQREFKSRKRDFEFNFINLLRSSSGKIAKGCTDKVNELDDLVSKTILSQNINDIEFEEIERKISLNKVEFLNVLFTYMENVTNKTA
jgi:hypothetical protein